MGFLPESDEETTAQRYVAWVFKPAFRANKEKLRSHAARGNEGKSHIILPLILQ